MSKCLCIFIYMFLSMYIKISLYKILIDFFWGGEELYIKICKYKKIFLYIFLYEHVYV